MTSKTKNLLFSVTIKDCDVETFTVGGAGGGGKDTSNTGVRITHRASGAQGVGVDHRSQLKNKQNAFKRMGESDKFQNWARCKVGDILNRKTVDYIIGEAMQPHNLKVEYLTYEGWKLASQTQTTEA